MLEKLKCLIGIHDYRIEEIVYLRHSHKLGGSWNRKGKHKKRIVRSKVLKTIVFSCENCGKINKIKIPKKRKFR